MFGIFFWYNVKYLWRQPTSEDFVHMSHVTFSLPNKKKHKYPWHIDNPPLVSLQVLVFLLFSWQNITNLIYSVAQLKKKAHRFHAFFVCARVCVCLTKDFFYFFLVSIFSVERSGVSLLPWSLGLCHHQKLFSLAFPLDSFSLVESARECEKGAQTLNTYLNGWMCVHKKQSTLCLSLPFYFLLFMSTATPAKKKYCRHQIHISRKNIYKKQVLHKIKCARTKNIFFFTLWLHFFGSLAHPQ